MSYPTPWRVQLGDVLDANDYLVIIEPESNIKIDLDDLVSRINAGAEAEARAERAEKALDQLLWLVETHYDDALHLDVNDPNVIRGFEWEYGIECCWSDHECLELATYLKEKEKK